MGSPLGPILANIFLSHHEENWLNKCPIKFKPSFYRRYVDDIFVLFESSESADSFREYMSSKHQNINFTVEKENVGSLSFLDVKICRKNGKFVTSVYRKPTFSGVFTNYKSLKYMTSSSDSNDFFPLSLHKLLLQLEKKSGSLVNKVSSLKKLIKSANSGSLTLHHQIDTTFLFHLSQAFPGRFDVSMQRISEEFREFHCCCDIMLSNFINRL